MECRVIDWDAVVIGTGFGGAMAAATLSEAGMKVLALEKGAWRGGDPGCIPFPEGPLGALSALHSVDLDLPGLRGAVLNRHGFLELHRTGSIFSLGGVGVGGSSLVYGGITQRPAPGFFDAFPQELTDATMETHFERAQGILRASPCPHPSRRGEPLQKAASESPRRELQRLPQAIRWADSSGADDAGSGCVECNLCSLGCNRGAKRSVDGSLVAEAQRNGATVLDLHEVTSVEEKHSGYRVHAFDRRKCGLRKRTVEFSARRVVLAAGTMQTHKLLFRSRQRHGLLSRSRMLGREFSVGGDMLGIYRGCSFEMDHGRGHNAETSIVVNDESGLRDHIVFPSELPFMDAWWTRPLQPLLQRTLVLAAFGRDRADGTLTWGGRGSLQLSMGEQPVMNRALRTMDSVAGHYGVPSERLKAPTSAPQRPRATVHPMGGCKMADTEEGGVVNFRGEVFGHPGLFIADASILAAPPVAAPSLSIAAISAHVAEMIVAGPMP